ncbi:MAG: polysaccharide deacetylase family protein [Myxococcota bacterium]
MSDPAPSFSLSIDVDSLRFYRDIHGLSGALELAEDPIYTLAMPRFFEILGEAGIPATLFLVGADAPAHPALGLGAESTGSEIASHSFAHDYRLTERSPGEIQADLAAADAALGKLTAAPIRGFRAPGYNVTPALLEAVLARGYRYDSSLLPAPSYFLARAAAIGLHRVRGRRSSSLVGTVRQFLGPLDPYRTTAAAPWTPAAGGALVELPMTCDPWLRVPLFGTALSALPAPVFGAGLGAADRGLRAINIELHAIDLVDHSDHPALGELAVFQRDLRVGAGVKRRRLLGLIERLKQHRQAKTLAEVAAAVAG